MVCWLAVCAAGMISSSRLPGLLTTSLAVPGSSSQVANEILSRNFGESVEGTFTVVFVNVRGGTTTARLDARLARVCSSSAISLRVKLAARCRGGVRQGGDPV